MTFKRTWIRGLAVVLLLGGGVTYRPVRAADEDALGRALAAMEARAMRAHIEFLASDLLEGRRPGTRGYDIAALYVSTQLAAMGLEPAGDSGSYFQQVPLLASSLEEATLAVGREGAMQPLTYAEDFVTMGDLVRERSEVEAPVVFAGYGVSAPGLGHDDYAGLDVKGKIVVVFSNAPSSFPTEQRAHFSSRQLKAEVAAGHGAVGMLFILTPEDRESSPWKVIVQQMKHDNVAWVDADGRPANVFPALRGGALLSESGARKLFEGTPVNLDEAYAATKTGTPRPAPLGVTARITTRSTHRRFTSPNVVARLEGSDPSLRRTHVVYSAHLDHVGVGEPVNGDSIYNGAYDNATGTAILIEAARALASVRDSLDRSILFLFVTAEESGLVGSDYFARHPTVARESIVANVNVDMPLLLVPLGEMVAFGAENSTLQQAASRAASLAKLSLVPDPWPEENLFIRSDQYSFVRQGVPAVFLVPGVKSADPAIDGMARFREFLMQHYHQPSDDVRLPMDLLSLERFARANVALGYLVATNPEAPRWKPGNFFGETFASAR